MPTFNSSERISCILFAFLLIGGSLESSASTGENRARSAAINVSKDTPAAACEDFAQRQITVANRLLGKANYSRALKVLNSTAENCDIQLVREKIVEVLGEWYRATRGQGSRSLQRFLNVLSNQPYVSSGTKSQFKRGAGSRARGLIAQAFSGEDFQKAHRLCRSFQTYVNENFEAEYHCGTAAQEVDNQSAAIESYQWLVQNWTDDQSLTTWKEIASPLEELYFLNGQFQDAYRLARQRARRETSPETILSSLLSVRGKFLFPILRAGTLFYENDPSQSALSHVDNEMQRVNFPEYVNSFYILGSDGSVERGMYGQEANEPRDRLLQKVSGRVSLFRSPDNSNRAWLVSPLDQRTLVLEFGIATTPEENVRLETVLENVESDEQWEKLYNLESSETMPGTGSAVATFLSAASLDNQNLNSYSEAFDASSLLTYYCVQNKSNTIEDSYNFDRSGLSYGDSEWERTSNTPALYHHLITYSDQPVREVVWPKFVDETWDGVIRIALTRS